MSKHSAQGIVLVKRKPENANGDVLKQQITLIAKDGANALKISDLSQFIKDLEGAGIVVSENQIDLIANKTYIRDGENGTPIALFADGKLNANLIDADTITVNHLYAKSAQGGTVVGHFGNYEKSDAVADDVKCPLWLGATTAANAPFRVTKDGAMYAVKGTIGGFEIGSGSIGSETFYGTEVTKMYLSNRNIIFNNEKGGGIQAVIGRNVQGSYDNVARLIYTSNDYGSRKCGLFVQVKNAAAKLYHNYGVFAQVEGNNYFNCAFYAYSGSIFGRGAFGGISFTYIYLSGTTDHYDTSDSSGKPDKIFDLSMNNVFYVNNQGSNVKVVFPRLDYARNSLGINDATTTFAIRLTIIGYRSTKTFTLSGRQTGKSFSSTQYPLFYNFNAVNDTWNMDAGDVCEVLLTFDGSEYYAQMICLHR